MQKLTTEEFITRSNKIHNNKYIYTDTTYVNLTTKVVIQCNIHGKFEQLPVNHLKGSGCPICHTFKVTSTLENFIEKANRLHNSSYLYTNTIYTTNKEKVTITCRQHGDFIQRASDHLSGYGCPTCGYLKVANRLSMSKEEYILKCNIKHNYKYDYSKLTYTKSNKRVTILCPTHGEFKQLAVTHSQGSGCPKCVVSKFNRPKDFKGRRTILYYIKIKDYYKIGITTSSVYERYRTDVKLGLEYTILNQWEFSDGEVAALIEQECLIKTIAYQVPDHKSSNIIPTNKGSSEIRICCILGIINKNLKGTYYELKT